MGEGVSIKYSLTLLLFIKHLFFLTEKTSVILLLICSMKLPLHYFFSILNNLLLFLNLQQFTSFVPFNNTFHSLVRTAINLGSQVLSVKNLISLTIVFYLANIFYWKAPLNIRNVQMSLTRYNKCISGWLLGKGWGSLLSTPYIDIIETTFTFFIYHTEE